MELKKITKKASSVLQKYKFVVLIAVLGIVLMMLPSYSSTPKQNSKEAEITPVYSSTQAELENILSQIDGAGAVRVMLTQKTGAQTVYQTNQDFSDSNSSGKIETVILTDADRNEQGLIKQINPPEYTGAIVLCQGAENPTIKLAIADAVSKITGLGLDKISVLKMK